MFSQSCKRRLLYCDGLSRTLGPAQYLARHSRAFSYNACSFAPLTLAKEEVVFSGIQPTGVPHIGNYLGALSQWVRLQNEASPSTSIFYSVVDLHSLTSHQPAALRKQSKLEVLAAFLAVGLDPDRCTIFYQSDVSAHSELHWILSCDAGMSWLSRMTQWKSKIAPDEESSPTSQSVTAENAEGLKLGLFSYPVLQAADILVHRATKVPVGEDQQQHVEFARNCAGHFNRTYAAEDPVLVQPDVLISPFKRVMSLTEPHKKMSKSHSSSWSRILLNDSAEEITKKIKKAVTDSHSGITYEPERRPGVSNLIDIICHLEQLNPEDVVEDFRNTSNIRLLKERTADVLIQHLSPIRQKYESLLGERGGRSLYDLAENGAASARSSANRTMQLVRAAIGI